MARLDWDDVRVFLEVARVGTVSGAARRLTIDHATVIRRIDALERGLSAKLFERTPRGYGLTQSGERLMDCALDMDVSLGRVREAIGQPAEVSGTVRINCLEAFANFFLARRLADFAKTHPKVRVELTTIQQIVALSRREGDIAITVQVPSGRTNGRTRLVEYSLYVYGHKDYLAGHPPILAREDLGKHRFAGYIDDLVFTRGLDYIGELLPGLRPGMQSSSLHAQMEFVSAGLGLCVLPAFMARTRPELLPVLPEETGLRRNYWLLVPQGEATPGPARAVRQFIIDAVNAEQALFA